MAKKETTKRTAKTTASAKTVHSEAARKVAKDVFAIHEDLDEIFVTSDGTPFSAMCDARNHARTLKNTEIITVNRTDLLDKAKEEDEDDKTEIPAEGADGAQGDGDDNKNDKE